MYNKIKMKCKRRKAALKYRRPMSKQGKEGFLKKKKKKTKYVN